MYKGYRISEQVTEYSYLGLPSTHVLVEAETGCQECEDANEIQVGHSQCSITPEDLQDDKLVTPVLLSVGWRLVWNGVPFAVDEWWED